MNTRHLISNLLWLLISIAGSQIVRLLSNLILTRLLVPEMFGLMVITTAVVLGINMFSDLGFRGAFINSKRYDDKRFCDTLWTLQIVRALVLCVMLVAFCVPISRFYGEPALVSLLLVSGIGALITGLQPVKVLLQIKQLKTKQLALIDLFSQIIGVLVMIVLAYYYRNVWSLVIGGVVANVINIAAKYLVIEGRSNWFCFDRSAFREIFKYGRWIFLSTGGAYLTNQGDRLIIGKYLTLAQVGIYGIAITFAMMVNEAMETVANKFLFPLYKKALEQDSQRLEQLRKYRLMGVCLGVAVCSPLFIGGQLVIDVLYDDRYSSAGAILKLLAVAAAVKIFDATLRPLFLASGNSFDSMVYQITKGVFSLVSVLVGITYFGFNGFLAALMVGPLLNLIVLHAMVRKYGYKWFYDDLGMLLILFVAVYYGWQVWGLNPLDLFLSQTSLFAD